MITKAQQEAEHFLKNEKQFHLGMLPTEQSNPKTRNLDQKFAASPAEGVKMLLSVDRDVYKMASKVLAGKEFHLLVEAGADAISRGKKIVLSGCGATGRLSILLESMWRCFFRDLRQKYPEIYKKVGMFENCVFSIMTGGDYALIRSVEYFEDYEEFGRQQVREMDIAEGDILVAITEGGETSSVLGTVDEAANRGAKVFLLFNNPAEILAKHIERSRNAIEDPRVTVLDLYCGPMAIAGSTRMQATTSEQLIAGAALEMILCRSFKEILTKDKLKLLNIHDIDYASAFNSLLDELLKENNTRVLGTYLKMEEKIYRENGLVTYFANEFLLDIFTDTTERAPTFMLPPFKKFDDIISKPSWAFVKNPVFPTASAWEYVLGRPVRCLEWESNLYRQMGTPDSVASAPPVLDKTQIVKFHIGNEEDSSRLSRTPNIAVNVIGSREIESSSYEEYNTAFNKTTTKFLRKSSLIIGNSNEVADYQISCSPIPSVLNLMEHLAVKLVLNTISTGTMVLLGRVTGNWMSWVEVSNKKLRDRGIRLISEICDLSYRDACFALHETLEELKTINLANIEKISPVQYTIKKIRDKG
jgi:N-acetylmuramic acid 6-phosphate etherase